MTRAAGAHNEAALLSFALKTTTARVEERCRELRCGTVDSLGGAQRAFANRSLRVIRNAEPLNIGRRSRTVPTAIKRALVARDVSQSAGARYLSGRPPDAKGPLLGLFSFEEGRSCHREGGQYSYDL